MARALRLVPAALLALAGCGKLDQIDVVRSGSAVVPGGAAGTPLPDRAIATFPIPVGRDALQAEGIDPSDVDSARLVALRLEVTQGTSLPEWLDSVSLHVEAAGLPKVLVASKSGIRTLPSGTAAVDLDAQGVDLKPYMLAQETTVTAEGTGNLPAADTTVQATATIRVDVNVSGLLGL